MAARPTRDQAAQFRDNSYGNSVTPDNPGTWPAPRTPTPRCWHSSADSVRAASAPTGRPVRRHGTAGGQRIPPHEPPDDAAQPDELHGPPLTCGNRADAPDGAAPVRLVGVSAEKTSVRTTFEQMDLFHRCRASTNSRRSWTAPADALRRKFGGAAVTRAKLLTLRPANPGPERRQTGKKTNDLMETVAASHGSFVL